LAASGWNLEEAARAFGTDAEGLALRIERSGFGYLLRQDVLDHYRAQGRRTSAQNTNPSRLWHSRM
jgi:hypothetical protein